MTKPKSAQVSRYLCPAQDLIQWSHTDSQQNPTNKPSGSKTAGGKKKFPAPDTVVPIVTAKKSTTKTGLELTDEERAQIARDVARSTSVKPASVRTPSSEAIAQKESSQFVSDEEDSAKGLADSEQNMMKGSADTVEEAAPDVKAPSADSKADVLGKQKQAILNGLVGAYDFPTENVQPWQPSVCDMHTAMQRAYDILDTEHEFFDKVMSYLAQFYTSMHNEREKVRDTKGKPKSIASFMLLRSPREKINKAYGLWESGTNSTYQLPQREQVIAATLVTKECSLSSDLAGKLFQMKKWRLLYPIGEGDKVPAKAPTAVAGHAIKHKTDGNSVASPIERTLSEKPQHAIQEENKGEDSLHLTVEDNNPNTINHAHLPAPAADSGHAAFKATMELAIKALHDENAALKSELGTLRTTLDFTNDMAVITGRVADTDIRVNKLADKASTLKRMYVHLELCNMPGDSPVARSWS